MADVLVIGAGAIGGLLAARLSLAGHEVAVVARGAHLQAMRRDGALLLETPSGSRGAPVAAYASVQEAPDATIVIVTLKAYQLPAMANEIAPKVRRCRVFVPIQNGIPWWYFQRAAGPHAGRVVHAVDPQGDLVRLLGAAPIVPAFATVAAEVVAPGHVRHAANDTDAFPMGALAPEHAAAAALAGAVFEAMGMLAPPSDVRQWVWRKLLGNIWANPIGALTRATVAEIAGTPISRSLALALMSETRAVARALGIEPDIDFEQHLDRGIRLRQGTKSSMLQDVERGRPIEHAAITGALIELAELADVTVPQVRTLDACLQLLARPTR